MLLNVSANETAGNGLTLSASESVHHVVYIVGAIFSGGKVYGALRLGAMLLFSLGVMGNAPVCTAGTWPDTDRESSRYW